MSSKHFILPFFLILLFSCNDPKDQSVSNSSDLKIKIQGSETMKPIMDAIIPAFENKNSHTNIFYTPTGSNVGIKALCEKQIDLAVLSRGPNEQERDQLALNGEIELVTVGYDGITVIVNRSNSTDKLTLEQLKNIFSGKARDWSDFSKDHLGIKVFARDLNSGSAVFFRQHILGSLDYCLDAERVQSNEQIISGIKNDAGAIGYCGLGFVDGNIKPVALSADNGKTYFTNSRINVRNQVYPLTRPLFVAYYKSDKEKVAPFVNYILSEEGQKLIDDIGFISVGTN